MKTILTSGRFATAHDIPSLLRERFRAAVRRNPRFSLRSFARHVGIDHSTLSQVLRGKRQLSSRDLQAIGKRVGLREEVLRNYALTSRKRRRSRPLSVPPQSYNFDLETFQLISVWYHYAILELTQVRGFKTDSRWIARALGIPITDVNIALQRLLRLGLLKMVAPNRWLDKSGDTEFHSVALTDAASDQLNQEIHELAIDAIHHVPGESRFDRQMIIALDSSKFPQLKTLAEEFMNDVRALLSESVAKDDVYQVAVSLFPLTTLKKTKGVKCPTR